MSNGILVKKVDFFPWHNANIRYNKAHQHGLTELNNPRSNTMTPAQIKTALANITSDIVAITPELASEWLLSNKNNRRVNQKSINAYMYEMTEGHWACNGETIIFDRKHDLLDGQQRLMAAVKSNTTIVSVVVYGVNRKDFDTMDQGRKRTNGQINDLNPDIKVNGTILSATTKAVVIYFKCHSFTDHFGMQFAPRMEAQLRQQYKGLESSVTFASNYKRKLISPTLTSALHYIFTQLDEVAGHVFMEALLTGDHGGNKELLKLREFFIDLKCNEKTKSRMNNRTFVGGVIVKAWNAWRTNTILQDFEYKKGESFPIAI